MGILDWFRSNPPERRALTTSITLPTNVSGYGADSGVYVNERTALQLGAVYACVRLLSDSVAGLPMDVYKKQGALRVPVDPTPTLIASPDPDLTVFEWLSQTMVSLALRGNSYHYVTERDGLQLPTAMTPVHPDVITIDKDRDTFKTIYKMNGRQVPREDIVHIRRMTLPGAIQGLSPIEQARQGIGLGLAAEQYGARWFGDSANPSAVLESDGNLSAEQAKLIQEDWVASHGGRRHPAMLSGGLRYRPIAITPEESQFLQTRGVQVTEIARMFGVPPHMIGDTEKSTSWGTGIEQQNIGFVTYTLRPWLICIEQALSRLLPKGMFVSFNTNALLRGDTVQRYASYQIAKNIGVLNSDEIRAKEDLAPIPNGGGQDYLQPLNMAALGAAASDDPAAPVGPSLTDELKAQADALGILIRAGVDPVAAAEAVGLSGLKFTGAIPVSLRPPEDIADDLEGL